MTAYHYAAREGKLAVIDTLLQRGASKHQKTLLGVSALTLACAGGHADVVRRLIRLPNENPRLESTAKRSLAPTPLIVATCSKSPLICGYLADTRVNMDETMDILKGLSAMSVAIICTPGLYMVRTLLDRGASATKKTLNRLTPEEIAIKYNRKDVFNFFSEKKSYRSRMNADSDLRREVKKDQIIERELGPPPQNGCTLLMYATTVRSINSAKHLVLHRDSDVNMRDNMHITALQIASLLRVDDIIPLLLQRNADVTVVNRFGSTAYDLFLMSSDSVEPASQLRSQLHCHRPSDMKLNLSNSSSNLYKTFGTKGLLSKVSSQILMSSKQTESIEPKQWLEAKVKYQPAKNRNTYKFASVEDILRSTRIAKRPETNEYDNETEATREYIEECQSFAVLCFTDFYGDRDKTPTTEYYDLAQYNARRSSSPWKDSGSNRQITREDYPKPLHLRAIRKNSLEREHTRKPRNLMDSPSQNQMRTTPRMLKKSRDSTQTEYYSAQAGRARASASANNVPTVVVARPRQMLPITDEMIWNHFMRRGKLDLMNALKKEEIDRHFFFGLKQKQLEEMGIYTPENLALIEEIQQLILSRSL
ncbi:hypothetical protein CAEBREN_12796 [Caenorhabditis brenneri]|uniref:Uncharacterized protein n=1 Tax=Caenorhabditis brenneri TaxID=135651 RepID=G0NWP2_CAEBE|nr:hypothetical protein CAEBREN_12796 [Caenorhabditis brenneri]